MVHRTPSPRTWLTASIIEAPQLAKDGVEDDPKAVSFWKVKHRIRFMAIAELCWHAAGRADLENRHVPQADG